jgi:hypothetical protein
MAKFNEDRSESLTGTVIQAKHKRGGYSDCIYLYFEDGTYLDINEVKIFYFIE